MFLLATGNSHVYDFHVCKGGDCGGVTGGKASKPVSAVLDCVSTFVNSKPLDICVTGDLRTSSDCFHTLTMCFFCLKR